jgi:drug/metabolite transporter (DMT)-like permease
MPRTLPKRSKSKNIVGNFSNRKIAYFFLTISTLVWGASLIIVKPAYDHTTPFRFLLYRYVLAGLFSLPFLFHYFKKIKNIFSKISLIFCLELIGTTLGLSFLYIGLNHTTAIEASLLTSTAPIFVVIAGILFLKEKQEKREWIGLAIAFLGTLALTVLPIYKEMNGGAGQISIQGNLLVLAYNIATAIYFILAKKYYKTLPKLFVTSISFYVGMVSFFLLSFWEIFSVQNSVNLMQNISFSFEHLFYSIMQDWSHKSVIISSVYMAIFGSIIGLTAYIKGQDKIEASEASLFTYLQPLVYIPMGIYWLQESIHWTQAVSIIIILIGVTVAEKRR